MSEDDLRKTICCVYPIRIPHGGDLNGYPQQTLLWRIPKCHPLYICGLVERNYFTGMVQDIVTQYHTQYI